MQLLRSLDKQASAN